MRAPPEAGEIWFRPIGGGRAGPVRCYRATPEGAWFGPLSPWGYEGLRAACPGALFWVACPGARGSGRVCPGVAPTRAEARRLVCGGGGTVDDQGPQVGEGESSTDSQAAQHSGRG